MTILDQNQNQNCLPVTRPNDNHLPGPVSLAVLFLALPRKVNLIAESSVPSAEEIRESEREFQSLIVWWKKLIFQSVYIQNSFYHMTLLLFSG